MCVASVNGDKGAVVNLEETNPKNGKQTKSQNLKIRKMLLFMSYMYASSIQPESGIKQKGKYLGVTEKEQKGQEV